VEAAAVGAALAMDQAAGLEILQRARDARRVLTRELGEAALCEIAAQVEVPEHLEHQHGLAVGSHAARARLEHAAARAEDEAADLFRERGALARPFHHDDNVIRFVAFAMIASATIGVYASGMRARVAVLLAAFVLAACSSGPSGPPKGRPPPLVTTTRVEVRDVPVEAKAPVDFRPVQQTDVGSKVLGYLDAVLVDVGDPVKKGQLLALVNPSDIAGQVSTVKGNLAQADASIVLAKANYERAKQLHPQGIVSNAELDQARAAYDAALANRQALEGNLAAAGARLGDTRILAPMDGFVYKRRLDPGALVGSAANPVILSIVRTDVLRVFVAVGERDAAKVAVGAAAKVTVDAMPDRAFAGAVVRVAPAFDPSTRTVDAEVHLKNEQNLLRPGMYGRAAIVLDVHKGAKVVPVSAVQIADRHAFVYVHKDGKASRREVELGTDGGEWLEIARGVEPGEEVLTGGYDSLGDGAPVRVAPPKAAATPGPSASASAGPR